MFAVNIYDVILYWLEFFCSPRKEVNFTAVKSGFLLIINSFCVVMKTQTDIRFVCTQLESSTLILWLDMGAIILETLGFHVAELTCLCDFPQTHNTFSHCFTVRGWHELIVSHSHCFFLILTIIVMFKFSVLNGIFNSKTKIFTISSLCFSVLVFGPVLIEVIFLENTVKSWWSLEYPFFFWIILNLVFC